MATRKFETLDALRGIAALAVVFFHLLGPLHDLVPRGYLAVDLFFLMSGFVVAAAYEDRLLGGWGFTAFLIVRLKRLWPLYAAGVVLGLLSYAAIRLLRPTEGFVFPPMSVTQAVLMSLLLLPQIVAYGGPAFPFNSASWSLSVELFGNIFYAAFIRALRMPVLFVIAGAGVFGLIIVAVRAGSLDVGVMYGNISGGYIRFLFSFPVGVLLYRLHRAGKLPALKLPAWMPLGMAAAVFTNLGGESWLRDIAAVVLIFPAILVVSLSNPLTRRAARLFAWAGAISYPLYILHPPLVEALSVLGGVEGNAVTSCAILIALIALAALAARYFDQPVQGFLARKYPIAATVRAGD